MILLFIIGISLVQFALYYLNWKYKTILPDFVILLILLACYFFVFPKFFYPEPKPDRINCLIPTLGITLEFWFFGTISGVVTHIIWSIKKRKASKRSKRNH